MGVTGYLIERCQGTGCSGFAQIAAPAGTATAFADSGLATQTTITVTASGRPTRPDNLERILRLPFGATTLSTFAPASTDPSLSPRPTTPLPQIIRTPVFRSPYRRAAAGDLNVVIVGWSDSDRSQVTSVTDTKGNAYVAGHRSHADCPGAVSQSIYDAANIAGAAAGANTVTVTFSPASASLPDVRILEYRGVARTSPFDAPSAPPAFGRPTSSGSGRPPTSDRSADRCPTPVAVANAGAGAGYTLRMITSPDGDLAEDRVVTQPASYSATAPLSLSGGLGDANGGLQGRAARGTPPNVSVTAPASGANLSGTVTVTVNADDRTPDSRRFSCWSTVLLWASSPRPALPAFR